MVVNKIGSRCESFYIGTCKVLDQKTYDGCRANITKPQNSASAGSQVWSPA